MSLFKIIALIVSIWFALKIKRLISGIQITTRKSTDKKGEKNWKADMDIKDADYEDIK